MRALREGCVLTPFVLQTPPLVVSRPSGRAFLRAVRGADAMPSAPLDCLFFETGSRSRISADVCSEHELVLSTIRNVSVPALSPRHGKLVCAGWVLT